MYERVIYMYNVIVILVKSFIPSMNLDEVIFIFIYMALMSFRSRSHVKASMDLMRDDNLFIHNYIRSLLNIILRSILMVRTGLEFASYCLCALAK